MDILSAWYLWSFLKRYIFNAFHQGKGTDEREGYGIGLAAAKTIVETPGGKILIESALGKGSVFTVVLTHRKKRMYPITVEIEWDFEIIYLRSFQDADLIM